MKYLVIFCIVLYFATATTARLMNDESDENEDPVDKRGALKDILSSVSCRYLRIKGYLNKHVDLKKLCLKTLGCKDVFSKISCNIAKSRNACSKNTKLSTVYCPFTCNKCGGQCSGSLPLGMQSGAIQDSKITASSVYPHKYYKTRYARLHLNSRGWAPKHNRVGEWLQVDLSETTVINGIATQGAKDTDEWVKSFSLQYSNNGKTFLNYESGKIFTANTDRNTVVKNKVDPPIHARYIRVLPKTWPRWPAIRMELYGCK